MARQEQELSPQRLFEAAEAALVAAAQTAATRTAAARADHPLPPALMGTTRQPRCLDEFARWEIEEATAFLIRLGVLDSPRTVA